VALWRDWLLTHNPVFHRNDVRAYLRIDNPLPLAHLETEAGDERRPNNRPDLVVNPFPYNQETRVEDYRHYRLPAGALEASASTQRQPALDYFMEIRLWRCCFPIYTLADSLGGGAWRDRQIHLYSL
jgi:hypothetical protein